MVFWAFYFSTHVWQSASEQTSEQERGRQKEEGSLVMYETREG